jgi:hypothetical protein
MSLWETFHIQAMTFVMVMMVIVMMVEMTVMD